jgi:hypothetical protein
MAAPSPRKKNLSLAAIVLLLAIVTTTTTGMYVQIYTHKLIHCIYSF